MNKKKGLVFGILIALVLVVSVAATSYARYISKARGTGDAKVATWAVQVNDTNIVNSSTFNLDGDYVTWSDSDYIADGYIAPGRTGNLKIKLDTTGSKVAIKYSITIDSSAIDDYSQIKITKVNNQTLSGDTYTGIISLDDVDTALEIPIEIAWTNADATNTSDTEIGSSISNISIPISVTVEQYFGN
ncbi:MAG TPA: hypothetical protein IAD45_00870 [Candidatus Faecimonas intestinavium]|nr:hypothetical protein [Candidatus Faecimonas intestinavium]